jgi:hypothetical protein
MRRCRRGQAAPNNTLWDTSRMRVEDVERELLERLRQQITFGQRGLSAEKGDPRGVMITYSGHVRGIWHWAGGRFRYTPAGYGVATHQADTIDEAVRITLAII